MYYLNEGALEKILGFGLGAAALAHLGGIGDLPHVSSEHAEELKHALKDYGTDLANYSGTITNRILYATGLRDSLLHMLHSDPLKPVDFNQMHHQTPHIIPDHQPNTNAHPTVNHSTVNQSNVNTNVQPTVNHSTVNQSNVNTNVQPTVNQQNLSTQEIAKKLANYKNQSPDKIITGPGTDAGLQTSGVSDFNQLKTVNSNQQNMSPQEIAKKLANYKNQSPDKIITGPGTDLSLQTSGISDFNQLKTVNSNQQTQNTQNSLHEILKTNNLEPANDTSTTKPNALQNILNNSKNPIQDSENKEPKKKEPKLLEPDNIEKLNESESLNWLKNITYLKYKKF